MTTEAERLASALENDGNDCRCAAHGACECACDANWAEYHVQDAAALLRQQAAEIERLKKANNAFALLTKSQEERISTLLKSKSKYEEATATLQSERDANASLTAEIERLKAEDGEKLKELNDYAAQVGALKAEIERLKAQHADCVKWLGEVLQEATDANALLRQALDALEEATTYTSSPSWSPSMTDDCKKVAAAIKTHLEGQQ